MEYPEKCIKGMPNRNCYYIFEGSPVGSVELFCFSKNRCRGDGWIEESINWMDDELAIDLTLNQRKLNGELQFRAGIAILPHAELKSVKKRFFSILDYERRPKDDNPYHGNILLNSKINNTLKTHIRVLLGDKAEIKPREGNQAG